VKTLDPDDYRIDEAFALTRRIVMSGLRAGRYRRRLASANQEEKEALKAAEGSRERIEVALQSIVLAAIQVKGAGSSAWDVVPADDDGVDYFALDKEFECERGCGFDSNNIKEVEVHEQSCKFEYGEAKEKDAVEEHEKSVDKVSIPSDDVEAKASEGENNVECDAAGEEPDVMQAALRAAEAAKEAYKASVMSPNTKETKRASSFLQCDVCQVWHSAKQLEISLEDFEALSTGVNWLCGPCDDVDQARKDRDARQRRKMIQMKLQEAVTKDLRPVLPELKGFDPSKAGDEEGHDSDEEPIENDLDLDDSDDEASPVFVENPMSINTLRARLLQRMEIDAALFQGLPTNWNRDLRETGRRRPQLLFVRSMPSTPGQEGICRNRTELEELLEKEHEKTNKKQAYLGNVTLGRWEIRRQHLVAAMDHLVPLLLESGLLEEVIQGKNGIGYVPKNKYMIGKPFNRNGKPTGDVVVDGASEEVSAYEEDRAANMARNAAFLASLGL